ncbi:hypothetical protein F4779DRAFT_597981 [Xylariaceae sp. FL0662B]|nr:hypothetical protein F4779DRAFT_597981 [Xylariaceae sp. FL0662B]
MDAYELEPSTSDHAEQATQTPESSDENKEAKYVRDDGVYLKWLVINGALFFILSIGCGITSHFIPAQGDRSIFDAGCTDQSGDSAEQAFHLDLTFGNFTFAQAKFIDITWDTTVGQGGRLLHGWILYCTVIYPLLVFGMETSHVTYDYYITLSFSWVSLETLWTVLSTLGSMRSYSVVICSILTVYCLGYTIFFPVIWSAATGYINQAHKLYAMPQGDVISLNSEDLALCWVLDSARLGLSGDNPHVEIGPNFSSIQSVTQSYKYTDNQLCFDDSDYRQKPIGLKYTPGGWNVNTSTTIWDHLRDYDGHNVLFDSHPGQSSRNFADIRAYALTTQLLQMSLNTTEWLSHGPEASLNSTQFSNATTNGKISWLSTNTSNCAQADNNALFQHLEAPEYLASSQLRSGTSNVSIVDMVPFNEAAFEKAQWSHFDINNTVSLDLGVLPYNSTFWLDDKPISLSAPFLDFGYKCSGNTAFTSLGNCVCYKGEPIAPDLLSNEKAICNTAPGYVWGFSSYLTRLGLILEAVWMACCFICYLRLSLRSELMSKEPIRTAGAMRLALDCSEAARHDIGPEVDHLPESTLKKRLTEFKISYQALESEEDVGLRYRVVSGMKRDGFRDRLEGFLYRLSKNLARWDERFEPINERLDPVSEAMNRRFNQASMYAKERCRSTKRIPTDFEVYEDINWRVYQ